VLAKVDRMSMQHALEVRAPLLGMDIAKFAMGLAADDCYAAQQGKVVLKRVASRYLPPEWMSRPKRGFGMPMTLWSSDVLLPSLRTLLLQQEGALRQWIEPARLKAYVKLLAREFHPYRAWALFILETWLRSHAATISTARPSMTMGSSYRLALQGAATQIGETARRIYRTGRRMMRGRSLDA
jgi:asparagine synthase (glutamine-hydrolysing)